MAFQLDLQAIRTGNRKDVAAIFMTALKGSKPLNLNSQLLQAIASELIPPRVYATWLGACQDPSILHDAFWQQHSIYVRNYAIRSFAKWFRSKHIVQVWAAVDGTRGIVNFLAQAAVNEVDLFCKVLASTSEAQTLRKERQELVTELLGSLVPQFFPQYEDSNPDVRPLVDIYCTLLPACTADMVSAWMKIGALPKPSNVPLLRAHPHLFQREYLQALERGEQPAHEPPWYRPLGQKFPDAPSNVPGISASTRFVLTSLKIACEAETRPADFEPAIPVLVRRLHRRRKRIPLQEVKISLGVILSYLNRAHVRVKLSNRLDDTIINLIRLWSRKPTDLEQQLVSMLRLAEVRADSAMADINYHVLAAPERLRLRLLKLLLLHLPDLALDLNNEAHLKNATVVKRWPASLFLALSPIESLDLLNRLIAARGSENVLTYQGLPGIFAGQKDNDPNLLRVYIARGTDEAKLRAKDELQHRKHKAATSREQVDRASWAREAMRYAIASGSLQLYKDVLLWARLFNKDALTVKALYERSMLHTDQGLDLLAGLNAQGEFPYRTVAVAQAVSAGNSICLLLLKTAVEGLREPGYYAPDWDAVRELFREVVQRRLAAFDKWESTLQISDTRTFNPVWRGTIDTCLAMEEIGLTPGHEKLNFRNLGGPLLGYGKNQWHFTQRLEPHRLRQAKVQFLDMLAQRRDELWRKYRSNLKPAVLTLPQPWPRGLSIQWLQIAHLTGSPSYSGEMPWLEGKAMEIVFMDAEVALQQTSQYDDEIREAIGPFVDDWREALFLYVHAPREDSRRLARAKKAWTHAVGNLSGSRMSQTAAYRYWKQTFEEAKVDVSFVQDPQPQPSPPTLPSPADFPVEWNPSPHAEEYVEEARNIEGLVIDCTLDRNRVSSPMWTIDTKFRSGQISIPARTQLPFWAEKSLWAASPATREAYIASALLYVESSLGVAADSLLLEPFPAADSVRYTAMFLDDHFLEGLRHSAGFDSRSINALRTIIADVPPSLLQRLTQKLFRSFADQRSSDYGRLENTFELIKMLARSDRPSLALDLAKEIVMTRPDDSAWHRQVLGRRLVNQLSAGTSRRFIRALASDIQEKLKDQGIAALQADDPSTEAPKPTVKVSTVKMVAQIMADLQTVPEADILDILEGLLVHVRHLNIRAAIVESLISRLLETKSESIELKILQLLRQHAVPIAASMNERHPLSEEEWQEAEGKCAVPEVYVDSDIYAIPPVMASLLAPCRSQWNSLAGAKERYLDGIVLPTLQASAVNARRWLNVLVHSLGLNVDLSALPLVPSRLRVLAALTVPCVEWLPRAYYQTAWDWVEVNLEKPRCISEVIDAVESNETVRQSDAWKYFESLWNHRGSSVYNRISLGTTTLLKRRWTSLRPDGITHADAQQQVLREARTVINTASGDIATIKVATGTWSTLEFLLARPVCYDNEAMDCWQKFCRPVVEHMVDLVDSLRTTEWQQNSHRTPAVLPDTFAMRVWLLPYVQAADASEISTLADAVSAILQELEFSRRPYEDKFDRVVEAVTASGRSYFVELATQIWLRPGVDNDQPSLADLLRLEMAHELLCRAPNPSKDSEKAQVHALLQSWATSMDEDVRAAARQTSWRPRRGRSKQTCEWLEQMVTSVAH